MSSSSVLGRQSLVAFISTSSAARAKAFYQGVLGLKLVSEDEYAIVFDANGATLRVQIVSKPTVAPYTALGWSVDDLAVVLVGLRSAGISLERFPGLIHDELGLWRSPSGTRIGWFKDPEGHVLSISGN